MTEDDATVAFEIRVDRERCMGSGNCTFTAPGVFDLDDRSVAVVVDGGAQPEDVVLRAARGCPTHAIVLTRDGEEVL